MEMEEKEDGTFAAVTRGKCLWHTVVDIVFFMLLFGILMIFVIGPFGIFFEGVEKKASMDSVSVLMMQEALMLVCALGASWIVLKMRKLPFGRLGLSLKGHWKDLWVGMLFAVSLYVAGFGLSLLLGVVEVAGVTFHFFSLLTSLGLYLLVGIMEESMMRGFVLGRMLDGGVNKFWALFFSSVLFSLMHIQNPNFEFVPFLNILLSGFLLGASYIYTRNLCFPIALHWFWNWLQGPVLGYEVSGTRFGDSILTLHLPEENLINGGAFGFEGSVLCTVLVVVGTVLIIKYYKDLGAKN